MNELRWILLGVAAVVVTGIYFFSRTRKKETSSSPLDAANEVPHFSARDETKNEWVDGVGPVRVVDRQTEVKLGAVESLASDQPGETKAGVQVDHGQVDSSEGPESTEVFSPEPDSTEIGFPDEPIQAEEPPADKSLDVEPARKELEADSTEPATTPEIRQAESAQTETAQEDPAIDDVIAVYVLASDDEPMIKGEKILSASFALKLEYGEMKIFHRYAEYNESDPASKKIRFSMANIMEPGWFDIDNINQLETRGVSFFMQVNLVDEPSRVLDDMLICAHGFATMLGARLCNPHRQLLDEAYTTHLREKVKTLSALREQSQ